MKFMLWTIMCAMLACSPLIILFVSGDPEAPTVAATLCVVMIPVAAMAWLLMPNFFAYDSKCKDFVRGTDGYCKHSVKCKNADLRTTYYTELGESDTEGCTGYFSTGVETKRFDSGSPQHIRIKSDVVDYWM